MPLISVILVTCNRKDYLTVMLESVKLQTFEDYEFIIVINGSKDGSVEVCEEYARGDSRVNIISLDSNMGASFGRNTGLAAATSDYIAFIDDDDICEPAMLSFLYNLAKKYDADISMCGSHNLFPDGRIEDYFVCNEEFFFDRLDGLRQLLARKLYNVAPPTKLFKRSLWDGLPFRENVLVDDIHVVYKVFEKANRIAVRNTPLYSFRKHASNMTVFIHNRAMTSALLDEYLEMYKTRAEYLAVHAPEIIPEIEKSMISFMKDMYIKVQSDEIKNCERQFELIKKILSDKGVTDV